MQNNFQFIDGINLNSNQLTQIAELIFETGYYEESSRNNQLNLPIVEFQKHVTVLPALNYIRSIVNQHQDVIAFHLSMTKQETIVLYQNELNYYAETIENMRVGGQINNLYIEYTSNEDLICHNLCVRSDMRSKGLFKIISLDQLRIAKEKGCTKIFSCTWETKKNTLSIYKHYGAKEQFVLDFTDTTMYKDRLIVLTTTINDLLINTSK